ncbi:carbohydrate ABC transporter permease [Streptomyces finlayi]|uniref:carbohydrate ABC transporter permease n=1 Tax=Streptomyces finlayi TaxID=67296 RepID=UPI00167845FB|nr:carbohydrate ABC transporter permease [Streptomyces finlayi]
MSTTQLEKPVDAVRGPAREGPRSRARRSVTDVAFFAGRLFVWVWVVGTLILGLWLVVASFKDEATVFTSPWSVPTSPRVQSYVDAVQLFNLTDAFLNTVFVVSVSTMLVVAVSAPCAYALARWKFRGSGTLTFVLAAAVGVPVQVLFVPIYLAYSKIGMINSLWGVILIYVGMNIPFTTFLLVSFFRSLPGELEEAAAMDGSKTLRTFFTVMLPLARPGLSTAAIITAIGLWNEFLIALTFLGDDKKYTLTIGLLNLYGNMRYNTNWTALFAGVVISLLPLLVLYAWLSNKIIEGLTLGSGK